MGTRMTLLYANFFMAALEKQMPTQVPPQSQTPHMATLHQRHIHAVVTEDIFDIYYSIIISDF